jgi:hypothetical protein
VPPQPQLLDEHVEFAASGEAEVLVLACGAIAREVLSVVSLNGWQHVTVRCLPGKLHSRPERIAPAVDAKLREAKGRYGQIFVAYADCGTGGALDRVLAEHRVERLAGAHCYGFFAGHGAWQAMHDEEPGTFYLTDFLARHFDSLVVRPLKLDRHPELLPLIFGNYRRVLYLAQTDDEALTERARAAAEYLGLAFERRRTGYGELQTTLERFVDGAGRGQTPAGSDPGNVVPPEATG